MLWVNRVLGLSIYFIIFSLSGTACMMLSRSNESEHFCCLPDLGKIYCLSQLCMIILALANFVDDFYDKLLPQLGY